MRVFIVHAHHEPASFNGAMTRAATAALAGAGHEALVSDLYAMGFNPVSGRHNFMPPRTMASPRIFKPKWENSSGATR
jgi:NAD(P)H dehydrogenase (quinone)